jgi:preprotein translocase subunit SecD
LRVEGDAIRFTLRDAGDEEKFRDALRDIARDWEFELQDNVAVLSFSEDYRKALLKKVLEQSIEIVRRRVDETGTREPIIQRQGDSRILLQVQ